jgi:hypothetical protein
MTSFARMVTYLRQSEVRQDVFGLKTETAEHLNMICTFIEVMLISGTKSSNVDCVEEVFNLNDHDRRTVLSWHPSNCCSAVFGVHNDCW